MSDEVSRLDMAFCVDLTGSMGPFIAAARAQLAGILAAMQAELGAGLRVAIVAYRDHCDGARLLDVLPLTADLERARATLDGLEILGGGDYPEAVYSGLEACLGLEWAKGVYRVVVLVGDAPPHACGAPGDSHPQADPSGWTLDGMADRLESDGVFVHALCMNKEPVLVRAFRRLSISTGGDQHDATSPDAALKVVEALSQGCLRHLAFDRRLLEQVRAGPPAGANGAGAEDGDQGPALAEALDASVFEVYAGLTRLRQRGLIG